MANYKDAYKRLGDIEGGYVNHPNDTGGETYAGISRKHWPKNQIWKIVDDIKKQFSSAADINKALQKNKLVSDLVKDFYKGNFWDVVQGDFVKDQSVAEEIFMQSVHSGSVATVRRLQDCCNFLIGSARDAKWAEIKADGRFGAKTLHTINLIDSLGFSDVLLYDLKSRMAQGFRGIIVSNKSQKGFYAGWLRRLYKK